MMWNEAHGASHTMLLSYEHNVTSQINMLLWERAVLLDTAAAE